MTGQIPPYSSFSELAEWGMYEPPPARPKPAPPPAAWWTRLLRRLDRRRIKKLRGFLDA